MNIKKIHINHLNRYCTTNDTDTNTINILFHFLNNQGYLLAEDVKLTNFTHACINYETIVAQEGDDICYIYNAIINSLDDLLEYDNEYFKYFSSINSLRIQKENFLKIAQLWKKHTKAKMSYLLLWIDLTGYSHLEAFQVRTVMNNRAKELQQKKEIIDDQSFKKLYYSEEIKNESIHFFVKIFYKNQGYTPKGKIPKYGLGELLRFLKQFKKSDELEQSSTFIKTLYKKPSSEILCYDGHDHILNTMNSLYSYVFAYENPTIPYIKTSNKQKLIPYMTPQNSLKLFTQNLPEIFESWRQILINKPACVLIWQDKKEWIRIESFDNEQAINEHIATLEHEQNNADDK